MKRWVKMCLAGYLLTVAVGPAGAAVCQGTEELIESFLTVYPTGGHAAQFEGANAAHVMQGLAIRGDGAAVIFLYSGDGPTTGARGRYMYLILDSANCVTDNNWVDGETFDRVSP